LALADVPHELSPIDDPQEPCTADKHTMPPTDPSAAFLEDLIEQHDERLGDNDRAFLRRVFSRDLDVYRRRLEAIGFAGLDRVLDAGCGFGQWTLALAGLNHHVWSVDVRKSRLLVLKDILHHLEVSNVTVEEARIERMPCQDAMFDAIFCYIAIFYTDWRAALDEFIRVLNDGGRLYVTGNDIGWYLHLWYNRPHATADYDPREIVARTFADTVEYERSGRPPTTQLIVEPEVMVNAMAERGLTILDRGDEGTIHAAADAPAPRPLFSGSYFGQVGCYEILARKEPTGA
jgi:SAM-dependent methyltransferase